MRSKVEYSKSDKITVKGQFPTNAHTSVPVETEIVTVSRHNGTLRGRGNALKSLRHERVTYARGHGNGAAMQVWIEVNGTRIDAREFELDYQVDARR